MDETQTEKKLVLHVTMTMGGGVGTMIASLIESQLSAGCAVALLCGKEIAIKDFRRDFSNRIDILPIDYAKGIFAKRALFGMRFRRAYRALRKKYPDRRIVVHLHNLYTVGLFGSTRGIPAICTLHGIYPSAHGKIGKRICRCVLRKLSKERTALYAVSGQSAAFYQALSGVKIGVVRNGVAPARTHVPSDDGIFRAGHVGFIDKSKGTDTVLEAYEILRQKGVEGLRFVVAGRELNDKDEIYERCVRYGQRDDFDFLGQVERAGETLVPDLDALVLPSDSEGMPMIILEAQAAGIPVIATPVGGIPEIVRDGYNGFLIDKDADQLAQKIALLARDRARYDEMRQNSLQNFVKSCNLEEEVRLYMQAYEALATSGGGF